MANYLKGIGDATQRINEILPSLDARIYNFLQGHPAGIIKGEFYEFAATKIDRGVIVQGGLCQAHGYFGCTDSDTQINFVMPSTTQYCHLYAEIDLSIVPNKFEIKATALSNSTTYSFRQDNLRSTTNGRYQLHLWQVTLTSTTITMTDKRGFISKPANAVTAEEYASGGGIATKFSSIETTLATKAPIASPALTGTPTAPTAAQSVNNTQLATTSYVRQAISDVKNITTASMTVNSALASTSVNQVRRQVNFVTGNLVINRNTANGMNITSGATIATIPSGYRPKSNIELASKMECYTNSWNNSNLRWVTSYGKITIQTDGNIIYNSCITPSASDSWNLFGYVRVFAFNFGYEIT